MTGVHVFSRSQTTTVLAHLVHRTTEGLPLRLPRRPAVHARIARTVLVAAVTATAVLVAATAWADGPPAPVDPVTTVEGATGALTQSGATTETGGSSTAATTTSSTPPAPAAELAASPPPIDLSQLDALLAQAGISTECSTSVQADIEQALADIPATAEQLLQEILDQLGNPGLPTSPLALTDPQNGTKVLMKGLAQGDTTLPVLSSPDPAELLLVKDIQQLLTDLLTKCLPAPPTVPAPPTTTPPPAAAPPAAQPVTYLGYAPTGGTGPAPAGGGSAPLASLGVGLLLTGSAGVVWYRVRSRAARAQD